MLMMRTSQEGFQYFMCPRFHPAPPTPTFPLGQKITEEPGTERRREGEKEQVSDLKMGT